MTVVSQDHSLHMLTVGIPTYQRREAVTKTVEKLLPFIDPPLLRLLVIDDGSVDGTFEALSQFQATPGVRILRNRENLRFAGNFFRLFEEAGDGYLLVTSDEDEVLASNLPSLQEMCRRERPSFVSPQAIIDNKVFRGRSIFREIRASEWRSASNYISGTTYNVPDSLPFLARIRELSFGNDAALVYPQSLLVAFLLAHGKGVWLPTAVTEKREQLPSHITDVLNGDYSHLASRWAQFQQIEKFLAESIADSEIVSVRNSFVEMLEFHRGRLFGHIWEAIAAHRGDLIKDFDRGARIHSRPRVLELARRALLNPSTALVGLRDRLSRSRN